MSGKAKPAVKPPLRVLQVASEGFPFIKTGGLADVVGALPGALAAEGVQVTTMLPGYPSVMAALGPIEASGLCSRLLSHLSLLLLRLLGLLAIKCKTGTTTARPSR